jgi:2'-5' RNA ligase
VIRAFVAVSIPSTILERIEETSSRLRELGLGARFSKIQSIHLTLKFLGEIEEGLVGRIGQALEESVRSTALFSLDVRGVGVFPNCRRPRVIWVGIEKEPELVKLQQRVEKGLQGLGFESEKRPFRPHLTLARLKSSRNVAELRQFLALEGEGLRLGTFEVNSIHLYQSILRPSGAEYRRLSSHSFQISPLAQASRRSGQRGGE